MIEYGISQQSRELLKSPSEARIQIGHTEASLHSHGSSIGTEFVAHRALAHVPGPLSRPQTPIFGLQCTRQYLNMETTATAAHSSAASVPGLRRRASVSLWEQRIHHEKQEIVMNYLLHKPIFHLKRVFKSSVLLAPPVQELHLRLRLAKL